jgi:ubiquinone/menaquinone biosynthesis C-methylase UbiE
MTVLRNILMRMFGCPQGVLGRLGGIIMARANEGCGRWVTDLLEIRSDDNVLEIGFGPGVIIKHLSERASVGHIAGVDLSGEMVKQARARNVTAIKTGRVDLRQGSAERLPFGDSTFDKALAINSMQVWPEPVGALREMRRVMKPGGRVALGFTPYSGQAKEGLIEILSAAGFKKASVVEKNDWFCAIALKE